MLHFLRRRRGGRLKDDLSTIIRDDDVSIEELQADYRATLGAVLARADVDPSCVAIDVLHAGRMPGGRPRFTCFLRLVRWERRSALRLLIGLPHIEKAARQSVQDSWLGQASHFGGLWLQSASEVLEAPALRELRSAIETLEQPVRAERQRATKPSQTSFSPVSSMPA